MLLSTPALVLHTVNYSETSVIAKIFTRQLGVRSYIFKGVRKTGSRTKQNMLQPLSYLDMVVYANPKTTLNYVKEIAPHKTSAPQPTTTLSRQEQVQAEAIRNAVVFFMTELLHKTLREEEPDQALFDYIVQVLQQLQEPLSPRHSQLPLLFMLRLSTYLGIEPLDNYCVREPYFDLLNGRFQDRGETTLDEESSQTLHAYLHAMHHNAPCPQAPLSQRKELIDRLLDYFRMHLSGFGTFTSHEILHTVLN